MATLVQKIIGTGGDYATWPEFIAAAPTDVVAPNQKWLVLFKNQVHTSASGFSFTTARTTNAECYFEFRPEPGAAWYEDPDLLTKPFNHLGDFGARLVNTSGSSSGFGVAVAYTKLHGLNIACTTDSANTQPALRLMSTTNNCQADAMILSSYGRNTSARGVGTVSGSTNFIRNSLMVQLSSDPSTIIFGMSGGNLVNVIGVSLNAKLTVGGTTSGGAKLTNVGIFNVTAPESGTSTKDACYSDGAATGWAVAPYSNVTFANISPSAPDFKLAAGSALIDAGVVSDATVDATGKLRPVGAAFDIGPLEYGTTVADTTAPVLSNATASAAGPNGGSGSVTTNEGNGTLYWLVSAATTATAAQVKAGQSKAVSAAGAQSASTTGLTALQAYRFHFLQRDAAGNDSAVISSSAFTTPAAGDTTAPLLEAPTATATGPTTATGTVATDEAGGLLYRLASADANGITAATVRAANLTQTIEATGTQDVFFDGLESGATLYPYYVQVDAAGNVSNLARGEAFTTPAVPTNNGTVIKDYILIWSIEGQLAPGAIDATKVPTERKVVFEGSIRVVSFDGNIRKVVF